IADRIATIPAHRPQDHITLEMAPLEIRHRSVRPISAKHAQASRFLQQSPRENLFAALVGGVSGWSISTPPPCRQVRVCVHELNKYAPTEQRPRLLLHGAWQRFLIFSHNVIGHKQVSFAFHPLLARTGHTSQLRILRKEQLSPALRLRLKIL